MLADSLSPNGLAKVPGVLDMRAVLYRGILGVSDSDLMALYALEVLAEGLDRAQKKVIVASDRSVATNPVASSCLFGDHDRKNRADLVQMKSIVR